MTLPAPTPSGPDPVRWLNNQPYLLLSLTSLFWAANIVLARYVAGHVPPMTLSCIRWIGAFLRASCSARNPCAASDSARERPLRKCLLDLQQIPAFGGDLQSYRLTMGPEVHGTIGGMIFFTIY